VVVEPIEFTAGIADEIDLGGGGGMKDTAADCAERALFVVDWPSSTSHVRATMPFYPASVALS
jgi:hypothetical protein